MKSHPSVVKSKKHGLAYFLLGRRPDDVGNHLPGKYNSLCIQHMNAAAVFWQWIKKQEYKVVVSKTLFVILRWFAEKKM